MPLSRANRSLTLSLVVIVACLFVIGIGVQAYVAQQDNADRDRADRAYADCLTTFAADLVRTIKARTRVNVRLQEAGERKDRALDQLIVISARAQSSGAESQEELPPGLLDEYERVLAERVAAQRAYDRVKARADLTRERNRYVTPQVSCTR